MRALHLAAQGCERAHLAWQSCGAAYARPRRRCTQVAAAAAERDVAAAAAAAPAAGQQQLQQQQNQQHGRGRRPRVQAGEEGSRSPFEQLMQHARLTHIAQELWGQVIRPGDTVVDATCGNGHDTECLAQAVGPRGTVHAFDVQASAIEAARQVVGASVAADLAPAVHFHLASHAEMRERVGRTNCARVVVFNLGYLPGSDRAKATQAHSTLAAVHAACDVLQPGGLCSILCYTGHSGGVDEYAAVKEAVAQLPPSRWTSSEVRLLNRPAAPALLLVWKREV